MSDCAEDRSLFDAWPELGGLPDATRAALAAASRRLRFAASDTVFTMGQADASVLYLVESGAARLTRADGERGDISVREVRAGEAVGLGSFAREDGGLTDSALQATEALSVVEVDALVLRRLAEEEGPLAMALLRLLGRATGGARRQDDPRARVFRHLLTLVRQHEDGRSIPEMPRHAALAEAAGVTDVEAAGAVADLIAKGIARRAYPGLEVLDGDRLHRVAFA